MPRRGSFLRVSLLVAIAIVLGVGAFVGLGGGVNSTQLKTSLERSVQRATGRAFTVDGPVHVTLGMSPTLTATAIRLANVAGGSRPDMLTAKSLSAKVDLLPLLQGSVVLEEVTLDQPDLLLEAGPDGTPNWQFHAAHASLVHGPDDEGTGAREPGRVALHRLKLTNGHVTVTAPSWPPMAADLTKADFWAEGGSTPLRGKIDGQADNIPFNIDINAGSFDRLQGGPVNALAGAWPLTVNMQAARATLHLVGGVNHPDELRGYSFLLNANAPDLAPLAPWLPKPFALPLKDVNLTVRLTDGANGEFRTSGFSLHAGPADLSGTVPGLVLKEAVVSAPGPGQQGELNIDGVFQGQPLRIAGTATQPDVLGTHLPIPVAFTAQAASANLSAHGTMPADLAGSGVDLTVTGRAPNLADLAPLLQRSLPDIRDISVDAHLGDAGFKLRGLHARDLSINSSLGDLSGDVTVAWAPVISVRGTVTSRHFDADGMRAAVAMLRGPPADALAAAVPAPPPLAVPAASPPPPPGTAIPSLDANGFISDAKLDFAALHGADGDLTISADKITLGGEHYSDLQTHLLATDGRIIVNPFRMTASQGAIIGALTIDAGVDPPTVALSLRSPALSAARAADLIGYQGGATGTLQVDAQLNAAGDTTRLLAASLGGHLGVAMVDGTVTDTLLQGLFASALSTAGVPMSGGNNAVRCLAARADFYRGNGRFRALALDTGRMSLDGDGTVDLPDQTLALHLRPIVGVGGTGVAAPVSVTGSFDALRATLDPIMSGGRVGITIGGPGPNANGCIASLSIARGGMAGPMPAVGAPPGAQPVKKKKPLDLLQGLFH